MPALRLPLRRPFSFCWVSCSVLFRTLNFFRASAVPRGDSLFLLSFAAVLFLTNLIHIGSLRRVLKRGSCFPRFSHGSCGLPAVFDFSHRVFFSFVAPSLHSLTLTEFWSVRHSRSGPLVFPRPLDVLPSELGLVTYFLLFVWKFCLAIRRTPMRGPFFFCAGIVPYRLQVFYSFPQSATVC